MENLTHQPDARPGQSSVLETEADEIELWTGGAPGALGYEAADRPLVKVYLPPHRDGPGSAVLVCPGGGYGHLADGHEGKDIAAWLNRHGIAAFVLRYRIAPRYGHPAPWRDAGRAMRLIRAHAAKWNIDPQRIGVWGFSAGGHLAACVATLFDAGRPDDRDVIERASSRPDFAILSYPVISLVEPYTHQGSRANLLGQNPDPVLAESLSIERQVTARTPPTFLFQTDADPGVPAENSVAMYLALRRAGVPAELHIYERGAHGVGLAPDDPVLRTWADRLADWLDSRSLLGHRPDLQE